MDYVYWPTTVVKIRYRSFLAKKLTIGIAAILSVVAASCTSGAPDSAVGPDQQPTVAPSSTITIPQTTTSVPGDGFETCSRTGLESPGNIQRADLTETSGLAASVNHPDVIWAVNDSGNASGIHAMDQTGTDLGFFALADSDGAPVSTTDVEDMALLDGTIYVADIGDNNSVRDDVTIYLVNEPDPSAVIPDTSNADTSIAGPATVSQQINIQYPEGPVDAEAFLVDPVTGQLVILDKDLSATETTIFTIDPPFDTDPIVAINRGTFDLGLLETSNMELTAAALLFPAAVTAADITADGSLIAVRTYGTVWLFPRSTDQAIAEALANDTPCEPGTAREGQGESLTFLNDPNGADRNGEVRILTVSEGEFRPLNIATVAGG